MHSFKHIFTESLKDKELPWIVLKDTDVYIRNDLAKIVIRNFCVPGKSGRSWHLHIKYLMDGSLIIDKEPDQVLYSKAIAVTIYHCDNSSIADCPSKDYTYDCLVQTMRGFVDNKKCRNAISRLIQKALVIDKSLKNDHEVNLDI